EYEVSGRLLIVAGSTLESTRILLNSKSRQHPNGLGNSSGMLGHYLVDNWGGIGASGYYPVLMSRDPKPEDCDGTATGVVIPPIMNLNKETRHPDFVRRFGFECSSSIGRFPGGARRIPGFGSEFKREVRKYYSAPVTMTTRAAMLSRFENFAEIDPDG